MAGVIRLGELLIGLTGSAHHRTYGRINVDGWIPVLLWDTAHHSGVAAQVERSAGPSPGGSLSKHAQTRTRSLQRPAMIGALAVGFVAATAGAAFSQERPPAGTAAPATVAPAAAAAAAAAAAPVDASGPAGSAAQLAALTGPLTVPPELVPPDGNVLGSVFTARGVQVYTCAAGAWTFTEPAATLTGRSVRPFRPVTAVHFRGPSWQSAEDGSLVTATLVKASTVAGSIPQLLLKAATTRGPGVFDGVTYVQRLATSGGAAPAGACTDGVSTGVAYRSVYRFFVAAPAAPA
jgi:hypothetical protein